MSESSSEKGPTKKLQIWQVVIAAVALVVAIFFGTIYMFSGTQKSVAEIIEPQTNRTSKQIYNKIGKTFILKTTEGKFTLASSDSIPLFEAKFDSIRYVGHDSKFAARENKLWGLIDSAGDFIIEPKFNKINKSKDDRLIVKLNHIGLGVYNFDGKEILPPVYLNIYSSIDEYLYSVLYDQNLGYGLIDEKQNKIIPYKYAFLKGLSDNILMVKLDKDGKYGLMNKSEKIILDCNYDDIVLINNKYINDGLISVKKEGKYGIVNSNNEIVIPIIYDEGVLFIKNGDYAKVKLMGKQITIDKMNNCVANCD